MEIKNAHEFANFLQRILDPDVDMTDDENELWNNLIVGSNVVNTINVRIPPKPGKRTGLMFKIQVKPMNI